MNNFKDLLLGSSKKSMSVLEKALVLLEGEKEINAFKLIEPFNIGADKQGFYLIFDQDSSQKSLTIWVYGLDIKVTWEYKYAYEQDMCFTDGEAEDKTLEIKNEIEAAKLIKTLILDYFNNNVKHDINTIK